MKRSLTQILVLTASLSCVMALSACNDGPKPATPAAPAVQVKAGNNDNVNLRNAEHDLAQNTGYAFKENKNGDGSWDGSFQWDPANVEKRNSTDSNTALSGLEKFQEQLKAYVDKYPSDPDILRWKAKLALVTAKVNELNGGSLWDSGTPATNPGSKDGTTAGTDPNAPGWDNNDPGPSGDPSGGDPSGGDPSGGDPSGGDPSGGGPSDGKQGQSPVQEPVPNDGHQVIRHQGASRTDALNGVELAEIGLNQVGIQFDVNQMGDNQVTAVVDQANYVDYTRNYGITKEQVTQALEGFQQAASSYLQRSGSRSRGDAIISAKLGVARKWLASPQLQ